MRPNMLAANRIRWPTPEPEPARTGVDCRLMFWLRCAHNHMAARRGHGCGYVDAPDATVAAAGFGAAEVRHLMAKHVENQNN